MIDFIVNAKSGNGKGHKTICKIMEYCNAHDVEYSVHITGHVGHGQELAKQLSNNGSKTIVAVGGDGTFHDVLNGIISLENVSLGFIPAGRGNDYARAAAFPLDPITALKAILRGEERRVDLFTVGDKRCLNVAGTGLDTEVLKRVAGETNKITYLSSLIYCIKHFEPYKMSVTCDNVTKTYDKIIMIGICNGTAIGGGMKISPYSKVDDGKLNAVIISVPEGGNIMKVLTKFLKGKHIDKEFTEHYTCEEISITTEKSCTLQIDGELYEDILFDCKISAGAIRTFK